MSKTNKRHSRDEIIRGLFALGVLLFFISILLHLFGLVSTSFCGFGVDSAGRLYVGKDREIVVFENGRQVYTIDKYTSRSYVFTILEDDTILLSTGSSVFKMDLRGEQVIDEYEDKSTSVYNELNEKKYEPVSVEGRNYDAANICGFIAVYEGETLIYHMPVFDYLVLILTVISFPMFFFACYYFRKNGIFRDQ